MCRQTAAAASTSTAAQLLPPSHGEVNEAGGERLVRLHIAVVTCWLGGGDVGWLRGGDVRAISWWWWRDGKCMTESEHAKAVNVTKECRVSLDGKIAVIDGVEYLLNETK